MELLGDAAPFSTSMVLVLTSIALFLWYYFKEKFSYWSRRGVPSLNPAKCFLQTIQLGFGIKPFRDVFNEQYQALDGHKYGGIYQLTQPALILRDAEIIRTCLIKGFSSFHDRGSKPDDEFEPLSGNLMFVITGNKWRYIRHKVSSAFSTAKMKIMYQTLKECSQDLNDYLEKKCSETGETEVEVKKLMSNYTFDVIGACAMGIKCNAIRDPDNCEFKQMVEKMMTFDLRRSIVTLLDMIHPKIPKLLGLKVLQPAVEDYMQAICKEAFKMKANDKSSMRKDFLQIIMNIQRSEMENISEPMEELEEPAGEYETENLDGPIFTENVITGVISSFLAAGVEPVCGTLILCLYELALNPEIQDKVFREIQTLKKEVGNDMKYEDLKKARYTEQVISETLRKYGVAGFLGRVCTESFQIPDSSLIVEKGVKLFIPIHSMHHNPQYFPEPEKFDPGRFSEENIDKIIPGTYIPFGDGPRFCIGKRFALIDVKTMLLTMISNFEIHTCAKTQKQIEFDKKLLVLIPKDGLWLRIKKRI